MKRSLPALACLLGVLSIVWATAPGQAATLLYWDPAGTATVNGGGAGTWAASSGTWYNGAADVNWTDTTGTATAVFGGTTAGTVTIGSGGVTAGGLTFNTAGYYLTGGNLTLAGTAPTITMNATGGTIGSILAGSAGLTVAGTGLLDLTGANTYTGGTTVSGGTLQIDSTGRTASNGTYGSVFIGPSTTLNLYNTNSGVDNGTGLTANSTFTGSGTLNKTGAGYIDLWSGCSITNFAGLVNVQQGIFASNGSDWGTSAGSMGLNVASGASFDVRTGSVVVNTISGTGTIYSSDAPGSMTIGAQNGSSAFGGVIQNGISLIKSGTGSETLTGANTYTGATTIGAGTLAITGTGVLGGGSYSGTIANSGTLLFNTSSSQALGGAISGNGSLTQLGPGTLTLTGANSFSGSTNVTQGVLTLSGGGYLNNTSAINIASGATLNLGGSNNNELDNANYNAVWNINGTLAVTTATAHTLYPLLGGGAINLTGGTMTSSVSVPSYGAYFLNSSATISAHGTGNAISAVNFGLANGTLTLNTPLATDTLAASTIFFAAAGSPGLAKSGLGTVTLSGANTYTGTTTINGGTLKLDFSAAGAPASNILASGDAMTLGGGTLAVTGNTTGTSSQTLGNLAVSGPSSIVLNPNGGSGTTLTVGNTWTQSNGATLLINLATSGGTLVSSPANTNGVIGAWAGVRDANGASLAVVSGGHVVGMDTSAYLPASGAGSTTNYWLGGGSSSQTVTASETANALAIIPAAAAQSLTINSGATLGFTANALSFDGTNYAYTIAGPGQLGTTAATLGIMATGPNALTIAAPISSGAGGLFVGGGGNVILTAASTYTGTTTIGSGTLQMGNGTNNGSLGTSAIAVNTAGTLLFNTTGSPTYSNAISGSGSLYKTGANNLTLSGTGGFAGISTISQGTLTIANASALASSAGTVVLGDANSGATNPTLYFNGVNPTIGSLVVGTGVNGATVLGAGVWGPPSIGGTTTLGSSLTVTAAGSGLHGVQFNGQITGNGGGAGNDSLILKYGGTSNLYVQPYMTTPDNFAGNVHVMGGNVLIQGNNASEANFIPATAMMNIDANAFYDYANTFNGGAVPMTIDGLAGGGELGGSGNNSGGYSLTINANTGANQGNRIFSGSLQNLSGSLTLGGSGTQEFLGGSIAYSNTTALNNGTLNLTNVSAWASPIVLGTTATTTPTLQLSATGSTSWTLSPVISGGTTSATVQKIGPGTVTLSGNNSYLGTTWISAGTLIANTVVASGGASNLGAATSPIVLGDTSGDTGALNYTGLSATFTRGFTVNSGGGQINVTYAAQTLTVGTGNITGSGPLTFGGAGTVVLAANNTYSGGTSLTAGKLYLNGTNATPSIYVAGSTTLGGSGSATAALATVANSGTLDFSQNTASTFGLAGLTFNGSATINLGALSSYYTSSPFLNAGALSPTSTPSSITIDANLGSSTVSSGTYDLIAYSGSIAGAGSSAFTLSVNGIGIRQNASLVSTGSQLEAIVTGVTPYWNGTSADWAVGNAWTLQPGSTPASFLTGDSDVFTDAANGSTYGGSVALNNGNVQPASVTFSNSALAYTLSGSCGITGSASLTVNGGGAVTISNTNGYTGGTNLAAGVLRLASSSAIGSGPLAVSGGTLNANYAQSPSSVTLSGGLANVGNAGALGAGALTLTSGSLDNTSGSALTLAGNNPQAWNGSFTFVGSNPLNLGTGTVGVNSALTVTVSASTLTAGGVLSGAGALTVAGGGTLLLTASNTVTGNVTVSGGTLQLGTGQSGKDGSLNGVSGVTDNATLVYNLNGSPTVTYPISGSGALYKAGASNLTLSGAGGFAGVTTISQGTLTLGSASAFSSSAGTMIIGDASSGSTNPTLNLGTVAATINAVTVGSGVTGATINEPSGWSTINGTISLGSSLTITTGYWMSPAGQITGNGGGSGNDSLVFVAGSEINFGNTVANNFLGNVHFKGAGTVNMQDFGTPGASYVFPAASMVIIDSGTTLRWNNANATVNQTVDGLSGGGTLNGAYPCTLTINANNSANQGNRIFSGSLTGLSGSLTLGGTGTQEFIGSGGGFTNTTALNNGTLNLTNATGWASPIVIGTSAANTPTLQLGATGGTSWTLGKLVSGGTTTATVQATGPGAVTVSGANTYVGTTWVTGGTLQMGSASALGNSGNALVANSGVLDLYGYNLSVGTLSGAGGTILTNSAGSTSTLTVNMPAGASTFSGTLANGLGTVALIKSGNGLLTLAGSSNTYSGPTNITAGTLALGPAGTLGSGNLTITAGAVLDTSAYGSSGYTFGGGALSAGRTGSPATDINGTFNVQNATVNIAGYGNVGTLTVANGGFGLSGGTLNYQVGDQIAMSGALTLAGTDYIAPLATMGTGTYTLFTGTSVPANPGSYLAMSGIYGTNPRQQYTFAASGGSAVTLTVSGLAGNLQWNGGTAGTWDTNTSQNWYNVTSGSADFFYTGDSVTFNDAPGADTTVALSGAVQPGSITVSNTAVNYTFNGPGTIADGTSLLKSGPGSLTINSSNSYSGGTTLAAGLLNLGNAAALGTGTLVLSGGSLDNTSGAAMTLANNLPQTWNGSFTFVGTNPLNLGTGAVALNASPTVTVAASTLTVGGPVSGTGALTITGGGTLLLTASNNYSGGTTITAGTLQLGTGQNGQDGSINGTSGVSNNATLAYNLYGNQTAAYAISGSGSLYKTGPGTLTLSGSSSFSGGITISQGVLAANSVAALGSTMNSVTLGDANTGANAVTLKMDSGLAATATVGTISTSNYGTGQTLVLNGGSALPANNTDLVATLNLAGSNALTVQATNTGGHSTAQDWGGRIVGSGIPSGTTALILDGTAASLRVTFTGGAPNNFSGDVLIKGFVSTQGNTYSGNTAANQNLGFLNNNVTVSSGANWNVVWGGETVEGLNGSGAIGLSNQSALNNIGLTVGNNDASGSFAGTINGSAGFSLAKVGSGTQVLGGAGNDPYLTAIVNNGVLVLAKSSGASVNALGGTGTALTINGGTAQLAGNGGNQIYDQAGVVANGGVFDFNGQNEAFDALNGGTAGLILNNAPATASTMTVGQNNGGGTFAGTIADGLGTLALTKAGSGTLVLTGSNTNSGLTTVSGGILQIGNGGTTGSIASNVLNNGVLTFNRADTVTGASVVSGGGTLRQAGAGTLILTAANSYTGPTIIDAGTLQVGAGGTTGSIDQTSGVIDNATLAFNRADDITFANSISGSGGLSKLGGNTLVLSNVSTYNGPTTVSAGTLDVSGALLGNTPVTVGSAATLRVDGTFGNGGVTLNGGTLVANGTLGTGAVAVNGGAVLTGSGTIGGSVTVAGGATTANQGTINLADGTIDALSFNGAGTGLTLGAGTGSALLKLDLGAGIADQIAVSGNLVANSVDVSITPLGSISAGTYNLVTFSGISGADNFQLEPITGLPSTLLAKLVMTGGTAEQLIIYPSIPRTAYWTGGGTAANWSTVANWATDLSGGTVASAPPGQSLSDVYFTATGGINTITTLDADFQVKSLNYTPTSAAVTINGSNTLTIVTAAGINDPAGAAAQTINANVALGAPQTWTVNSASPLTVGGVISGGTNTLTLAGSGTVILTAANTYSGQTTISAGILQLGDGTANNGSLSGDILNNSALVFANATTQSFAGAITGSGGVTVAGPGTLILDGGNGYTGGTTVSGGGLALGNASALGTGGLVLAGGAMDLAGFSTSVPSLSLTGGTLTGSGQTLTVSGSGPIDAESGAASANLAGSVALNKTTGGTLLISGNNTYTGGTSLSAGVLQLGNDNALPAAGTLTINAGTLDLGGHNPTVAAVAGGGVISNSSGAGAINVNANAPAPANLDAMILDGAGTTGVVKSGSGTLIVTNAANNYSGGTTVASGVLQLGNATALGSTAGPLSVNAGTLDLAGNSATVGALTGAGMLTSSVAGATLTAGAGNGTSAFNGVIVDGAGSVAFIKVGSGTLALTGANNYSGGTTISGGELSIASSSNLGSGNLTIGAGALQTTGNVVLDANRKITLTDSASAVDTPNSTDQVTISGPVTGNGALNKIGAGTLDLANPSGDDYTGNTNVLAGTLVATADNALSPASNLVIGDGATVILGFGGGAGDNSIGVFAGGVPTLASPTVATPALAPAGISTVPEPGTLLLLLAGALAGLAVWRRRSR